MINALDDFFLFQIPIALTKLLKLLSLLADPKANLLLWGILSCYLLWRKKPNALQSNVLYFFVLTNLIMLICGVLKITAGRARPYLIDENIVGFYFFSVKNAYLSFPSSHSAIATAFALVWKRLYKLNNSIFLFPLLICSARILLKAHFATDVLFGLGIGVFSTMLMNKLYKPFTQKIYNSLKIKN